MILLGFLVAGIYTAVSGPAWDGWRARRKQAREFPVAKVVFCLPSAVQQVIK